MINDQASLNLHISNKVSYKYGKNDKLMNRLSNSITFFNKQ